MSDNGVQFYESGPKLTGDKFYEPQNRGFGSKLAGLIIRYSGGLVKTQQQANYVVLAMAALIFIISIILFSSAFSRPKPSPEEIEMSEQP